MRMFFTAPVLAGALLLGGCGDRERLVGRPDLAIVGGEALPPPSTQDLIAEPRAYVIGPFDKVAIDVFGVQELQRTVTVDASGRIALPLAGTIEASGLSAGALSELIAERLRGRYVRDPQVAVNVTEINSQVVTVSGAVETPGVYPVQGRMTLLRAIARAEGTTEFARENFVIVYRRVNGRDMAALYDVRAIRQGLYADPQIFPNDTVLVGDSAARRQFRDLISASGILAAPLVTLLR